MIPSISAAIVISRKATPFHSSSSNRRTSTSASAPPQICVVARVPRKRTNLSDSLKYTIQCFVFLDDPRRFVHLDSLLTRFGNVSCIHVACTETAEKKKAASNAEHERTNQQLSDMLGRVCDVVNARSSSDSIIARKLLSLGKPLQSEHSAVEYTDSIMGHLLGSSSVSSLTYRGNRLLAEVPQLKQALGLLLREEGLSNVDDEPGQYDIQIGNLTSHMQLDRIAAESIHLLPPPRNAANAKCDTTSDTSSIFGILNKCKTKMGSRLLETWLRQPLINKQEIEARHDVVESLIQYSAERDQLRDSALACVGDLDTLASKLSLYLTATGSTYGGLELLYRMYLLADQQLPRVVDSFQQVVQPNSCSKLQLFQEELFAVQTLLLKVKELAEEVLDLEFAPREFLVKSRFNENLQELKKELLDVDTTLENLHTNMDQTWSSVSGQGQGQVRLETIDQDGCAWQFRLPKTNDEKILREELGDTVQVHRLLKNGVYFSTKQLRDLGTRKQNILAEYQQIQKSIVDDAMRVAATYVPLLEKASTVISEIDVLASFAHVAAYHCGVNGGYCRPIMTDSDDNGMGIKLINARHPCVELQDDVNFIPNSYDLALGQSSFLLVTGPNMGGKSVYIRSLGAIVTMAQVGSFVPCDSATINIVDSILARVGAGDAQQRGISTFMAEMLEASSILQSATKRSLVIIDEMGRGTSTFDGFGIAWAISEFIIKKVGCITLFATHFHELTALEQCHPCAKNCHVTAIKPSGSSNLTFLYEVKPGPCLESFGIQVAEMANVPPSVIVNAKRKAKELENFDYQKHVSHQSSTTSSKDIIKRLKVIPLKSIPTSEGKLAALGRILGVV